MGAWSFVEPYLEWVLEPDRRQAPAAALCRPPGVGGDRDRPDVEASGAAQGVARRGAGLIEPHGAVATPCS